jgi:hypothetical protein
MKVEIYLNPFISWLLAGEICKKHGDSLGKKFDFFVILKKKGIFDRIYIFFGHKRKPLLPTQIYSFS